MAPKVKDKTASGNKNRSSILLTDKVKIIHDLENGSSVQEVMVKYKIRSRYTVYTIQRSKVKILESIANIHGNIGMYILIFIASLVPLIGYVTVTKGDLISMN